MTGVFAGAFVVMLFALPVLIHNHNEQSAAAIRQENLVPARGEAFDSVTLNDVTILAMLEGSHNELITVSADSMSWYSPQNGEITLPLVAGVYEFRAAFENRMVILRYDVNDGHDNRLVLDIKNAPSAPELTFLEVQRGDNALIPLDIEDAVEVRSERLPNGMKVVRQGSGYALSIDGGMTEYGFYPFSLIAENEYGQATAHVGVRIPNNEPPTEIFTVDDFKNIRSNLSGSYVLMNDLDMGEIHDWTPIGTLVYPFTGVLDGGGYEITGFHAPERITEGDNFSLIGFTNNAEIRGIIVREPHIVPEVPEREGNIAFSCCVIAGGVVNSLMENCASIGGIVSPSDNYASGLCTAGGSIILGLFSSTEVVCNAPNRYLPNTGGLFFAVGEYSYVAYCANEGDVFGRHLSGGITAYNHTAEITRCISSGYISGSTLVGEFPPGGIMQTTDFGTARYCLFAKGMSAVGGKVFNPGVLGLLAPIDEKDLRNKAALSLIGTFDGDSPDWAFASLDANGPVPFGIFKRQVESPQMPEAGNAVVLPPVDGIMYFYTLDGSNPYTGGAIQAESLTVTLSKNQTLTVYAAQKGFRDSDIVSFNPEGGQ